MTGDRNCIRKFLTFDSPAKSQELLFNTAPSPLDPLSRREKYGNKLVLWHSLALAEGHGKAGGGQSF